MSIRVLAMTIVPDWLGIARLPASLSAAGFEVASLCPEKSFLAQTSFVRERFFIAGENITESLAKAVTAWDPHFIIPGDEWNAQFLHYLDAHDPPDHLRQLIRRSCGDPRFYDTVTDKRKTLEAAAKLGIRTPPTAPPESLATFAALHSYPLVVKLSIGMSGLAVRICSDASSATKAIAELRAIKVPFYVQPSSVSIQKYVAGTPAAISFAALEGQMLDSFTYRSEETSSACGPGCVVRKIDHQEIEQTARLLIAHFGFTGFGGFDFMIAQDGNDAFLLEMNPRVPITGHLGAVFGHDLTSSLYAGLTGVPAPRIACSHEIVALFPHEWLRDSNSPNLSRHYVDAPWNDPALLRCFRAMRPAARN